MIRPRRSLFGSHYAGTDDLCRPVYEDDDALPDDVEPDMMRFVPAEFWPLLTQAEAKAEPAIDPAPMENPCQTCQVTPAAPKMCHTFFGYTECPGPGRTFT